MGVSSLEGFTPTFDTPYVSLIDAKIGGVYWQSASRINGEIHLTSSPQLTSLQDFPKLHALSPLFLSPNLKQIKEKIEKEFAKEGLEGGKWEEVAPNSIQLTRAALKKMQSGDVSLDGRLEILYLRKTQAEIERGK